MSASFLQSKVMILPFVINRYLMAKPFTILRVWVTRRNGWPHVGKKAPCLHFQFFLDEIDQRLFQDFAVLSVTTVLLETSTWIPSPHSHPQQRSEQQSCKPAGLLGLSGDTLPTGTELVVIPPANNPL